MADPRLSPKFEQIDATYMTFKYDNSTILYDATKTGGSAGFGLAVLVSAAATVALVAADDRVAGKLWRVEADGSCQVQIGGACTLPQGSAVTTTPGKSFAGALGAASAKGFIKELALAGATYVQAEANNAQKARGIILDNTDTANVAVWLD